MVYIHTINGNTCVKLFFPLGLVLMTHDLANARSRYAIGLMRLYLDRFEQKPLWKSVHYLYTLGLIPIRFNPLYHQLKRRLYDSPMLRSIS